MYTLHLGDPQLSVMDSVEFHELLHVVRIDVPTDDDLPDFLTVHKEGLLGLPRYIYRSDNGMEPLNVTVGNVTSLTSISKYVKTVYNLIIITEVRCFLFNHISILGQPFFKHSLFGSFQDCRQRDGHKVTLLDDVDNIMAYNVNKVWIRMDNSIYISSCVYIFLTNYC